MFKPVNPPKKITSKAEKTKSVRQMRPYPLASLERALGIVNAIKEKNGGNPLAPQLVAEYCKISTTSSDFVSLLAAANRFGLITGTRSSEGIALADLGREVAYAGTPQEEYQAKCRAFYSVDIFKRVFEYYNGSQLPEMKYLGNTLQKEFGLIPSLHEEFSRLFRENTDYLKLHNKRDAEEGSQNGSAVSSSSSVIIGEPKKKTGRVCFVIMPFKERTDGYPKGFFTEVLNSLVIPALTNAGFEVRTANRQGTEIIHSTIVNDVLDADLAVCDLTEHNPNVLFELGMRLAAERPVALIHAEGTERVFDVDNVLRVFAYSPDLWRTTLEKDLSDLKGHVVATWDNKDKTETYIGALRKIKKHQTV